MSKNTVLVQCHALNNYEVFPTFATDEDAAHPSGTNDVVGSGEVKVGEQLHVHCIKQKP